MIFFVTERLLPFFFHKDYGSRKCQFWDFLTIICSVYCSAQETFLRKEGWEWQCGARSGRVGQRTAHEGAEGTVERGA